MAYIDGPMINKVLIKGVLHPIADNRIEGTNFAYVQIAGDVVVDTPLTAEQLAHITPAVLSEDGAVFNIPALGTILIPKDVVIQDPAPAEDYKVVYTSSPLEGKVYNLEVTIDHTTGEPKEAVVVEGEVATPPVNIAKTDLEAIKATTPDPTSHIIISDEAKALGQDAVDKKANIIVETDADGQPIDVYHATESPEPDKYYRYIDPQNHCIDIYFTKDAAGVITVDGLLFPDQENIYVEKAKEYMEISTTQNSVIYKSVQPVMVEEHVLGFEEVEEATQTQGTAGIIHYPKSVLFTSDAAFELKLASTSDAPTAKIEVSKDGLTWSAATWSGGVALKADTLNSELGKYSIFVKADDYLNDAASGRFCSFTPVSGSNIEASGIIEAMWGCKPLSMGTAAYIFSGLTSLVSVKNLVLPKENAMGAYIGAFNGCTNLKEGPAILPAPEANCYQEMFKLCTSLVKPPILTPAETMPEYAYAQMFEGCSKLVEAPALPATTLSDSCYMSMLAGTAITYPPALPATTLAENCYSGMFGTCAYLTTVPELPATELPALCYDDMFVNCTGLTAPATFPVLTSVAIDAFFKMFEGCVGIKWATSGIPYEIKTTDGSTAAASTDMFAGNTGNIPETSGTPKLNTTYYLEA